MKAIIVDDETNARNLLKNVLERYCPNVNVIGEADGVQAGYELLKDENPDVLFLDIKMNDGTGFDLIELLDAPKFKLIFTTAFDEFAVKAFKYGAVDYILKPITPIDLKECIKRIESNDIISKEQIGIINSHNVNAEKIALPSQEGIHMVNLDQILYCKGEGSYTSFFTIQNDVVVSKNLSYYADLLSENIFFRVHQSYLVNLDHVKTIQKTGGGFLLMTNNHEIPISRRRKDELFKKLNI
jgi:two-component system LytT family response regulator